MEPRRPFNFVWENPHPGDYALTAVATDATGMSTTSETVNVSVADMVNTNGVESAFLVDVVPMQLRNDYSGFIGMEITVGPNPITVTTSSMNSNEKYWSSERIMLRHFLPLTNAREQWHEPSRYRYIVSGLFGRTPM